MNRPDQLDNNLAVTFVDHPVYMSFKSKQEGQAIYEDKLYISISIPFAKDGDIFRPAQDKDKTRFPDAWHQYENKITTEEQGTPISNWNYPNKGQVAMLASQGIKTVERVAALGDASLKNMGQGARGLRDAARSFVEQGSATANQVAELQKQVAVLIAEKEEKPKAKGRPKKKVETPETTDVDEG